MATALLLKDADPASLAFEPLAKSGSIYVAKLSQPLFVQTPPMVCCSDLTAGGADDLHPYLFVKADPALMAFLTKCEEALVQKATGECKAAWFPRTDDHAIRGSLRSYLKPAEGIAKFKVDPEVAVYDSDPEPGQASSSAVVQKSRIQAIIAATRVCFGKTEWGMLWRVVQVRVQATPRSMFQPEADGEAPDRDEDDFA